MRKWVAAAAMIAGLGGPALAQDGQQKDKHWTWVSLLDGTVGWEDGGVLRDEATNTAALGVFLYSNDPKPLPAGVTRRIGFETPDQTYDYEMRVVTYSCAQDTMRIEAILYFTIMDGRTIRVANGAAQPEQKVDSLINLSVKRHVCEGVKPDGAGEAKSSSQMVSVAVTLEKRAREKQ
jgi:hypothetical protein